MDVRLKDVWEHVDRHGNVRIYVKVPGRKKVRIRQQPGTPEFMAVYNEAIEGASATANSKQHGRGSFGFACKAFFASKKFQTQPPKGYDELTKWIRNELERICEKHGDKPFALMKPEHIRALRDEKDTPDASNMRLKALRALFKWAVEAKEAQHNPAKQAEMIATNSDGYHTWTDEEIEQFENRHPMGTKARLAMALMLYTTGSREDAVRLGPQHIRKQMIAVDGKTVSVRRIVYTQAKNELRLPIDMDIPLHPRLEQIIDAMPSGHMTFLVTEFGKPFTPAGFGTGSAIGVSRLPCQAARMTYAKRRQ
jgi:integrase/recombinase XerD